MLCDSVPTVALQHCPALAIQAQQVADKHRQALLLFSACHNIYAQNYVENNEVNQLGNYCLSCTQYICSFMINLFTAENIHGVLPVSVLYCLCDS